MSGKPDPTEPVAPSREDIELRTADYRETVGLVNLLTDVRFKLAAFVPTLTAAAVALISTSEAAPPTKVVFGVGGLVFVLGIVVYDLRNSQIYNGAIGRATKLEKTLFDRYGGDAERGLFGSRRDTNRTHRARGTDRYLRLSVTHGTGLTLVYTAALTAWVWVILAAVGDELLDDEGHWQLRGWMLDEGDVAWCVAVVTVAVGLGVAWAHHRHEQPIPPEKPRPAVFGVRLSKSEREKVRKIARRGDCDHEAVLHRAIRDHLPAHAVSSKDALAHTLGLQLDAGESKILKRRRVRRRLLDKSSERRVRAAVQRLPNPEEPRPVPAAAPPGPTDRELGRNWWISIRIGGRGRSR